MIGAVASAETEFAIVGQVGRRAFYRLPGGRLPYHFCRAVRLFGASRYQHWQGMKSLT